MAIGAKPHILFYFIPGNPGYIGYYDDFFAALRGRLAWAEGRIHIRGRDLAGFDDSTHEPFNGTTNQPYVVADQIDYIYDTVASLRRVDGDTGPDGEPYDLVVLAGHSVGSYIALEVFQRHLRETKPGTGHLRLGAGMLLFPTVTHIARSPQGRKLSLLASAPAVLRDGLYLAVRAFLFLWPVWVLRVIVSRVMGFSERATEVTVGLLRSRDGVRQGLHMGMDEMRVIGEEKWDEELWTMPASTTTKTKTTAAEQTTAAAVAARCPKFFFLFGEKDHWVSDHFRAQFIRAREKQIESGWARVELDETGLPHAFCATARNSEIVAERAAAWMKEVYEAAASDAITN